MGKASDFTALPGNFAKYASHIILTTSVAGSLALVPGCSKTQSPSNGSSSATPPPPSGPNPSIPKAGKLESPSPALPAAEKSSHPDDPLKVSANQNLLPADAVVPNQQPQKQVTDADLLKSPAELQKRHSLPQYNMPYRSLSAPPEANESNLEVLLARAIIAKHQENWLLLGNWVTEFSNPWSAKVEDPRARALADQAGKIYGPAFPRDSLEIDGPAWFQDHLRNVANHIQAFSLKNGGSKSSPFLSATVAEAVRAISMASVASKAGHFESAQKLLTYAESADAFLNGLRSDALLGVVQTSDGHWRLIVSQPDVVFDSSVNSYDRTAKVIDPPQTFEQFASNPAKLEALRRALTNEISGATAPAQGPKT